MNLKEKFPYLVYVKPLDMNCFWITEKHPKSRYYASTIYDADADEALDCRVFTETLAQAVKESNRKGPISAPVWYGCKN